VFDRFITEAAGTDLPEFRLKFLMNNKGVIDSLSMSLFGYPVEVFAKK